MLRVSVLELPARWGNPEAAIDEVDRLLASGGPTDLVVVPELGFTGYVSPEGDFDVRRFAETLEGPTVERLGELCLRHRVAIAAPLVLHEDGAFYNALVLVGPEGDLLATYRKRHPWFPEEWATAGETAPPIVRLGSVDVTFAICFDGHFLGQDTAEVLRQVDLLVFTSAWVESFEPDDPAEDSRVPLLRGLAGRFGITIANANWAPGVVRLAGQGGSCILGPEGEVRAEVSGDRCRANATVKTRSG